MSALETVTAKIAAGEQLTDEERQVAEAHALYAGEATGPPPSEEPVALVRHDDLVAWVENELTPKLARIVERQDALEAQIDLFKDESKQESDWLRKAYEELSGAVSDHTKSLEAIDHDHAQRVVDTVREEAAKAGEVVDEKLRPIESRLATAEEAYSKHEGRLERLETHSTIPADQQGG